MSLVPLVPSDAEGTALLIEIASYILDHPGNPLCPLILRLIEIKSYREAGRLISRLDRNLISKGEQRQISQFIEHHGHDAEWGFPLQLQELNRAIASGQYILLPKIFDALFDLCSGKEQALKERIVPLLKMPKQSELAAFLLLHPKIDLCLTKKEQLEAITPLPQTKHYRKGD